MELQGEDRERHVNIDVFMKPSHGMQCSEYENMLLSNPKPSIMMKC